MWFKSNKFHSHAKRGLFVYIQQCKIRFETVQCINIGISTIKNRYEVNLLKCLTINFLSSRFLTITPVLL